MTASLRSKSQTSNPKSQRGKPGAAPAKPGASAPGPDGSSRGILPQPSRQPLPMKRHKALFLALMSVFVAWVGVMLGMYFMTVRPQRHLAPMPPLQSPQPPGATTTTRAVARMVEPSQAQTPLSQTM